MSQTAEREQPVRSMRERIVPAAFERHPGQRRKAASSGDWRPVRTPSYKSFERVGRDWTFPVTPSAEHIYEVADFTETECRRDEPGDRNCHSVGTADRLHRSCVS